MLKKAMSVLLIFSLLTVLNSCSREKRISFSELIKRMNENGIANELHMSDAFFSDGEWFLFIKHENEDKLILTAAENADSKYIEKASVSVINDEKGETAQEFISLCEALTASFTFDIDKKESLEQTGLYDKGMLFSESTSFYDEGRFSFSFFNADLGSTLLIEIK